MPAMHCCRRSWRVASDEFVWSSLFGAFLAASGTAFAVFVHHFCESAFAIAQLSLSSTVTGLFLLLALSSFRGTMREEGKRCMVGPLLWIVWLVSSTSLSFTVIFRIFIEDLSVVEPQHCLHRELAVGYLNVILLVSSVVAIFEIFAFLLALDCSGHDNNTASRAAVMRRWVSRLRMLFCCTANESLTATHDQAMTDAAEILSDAFIGLDLVPSDITARLILLSDDDARLRQANQGRQLNAVPLPVNRYADIEYLRHYFQFALATYGWMYQQWSHPLSALPHLCWFRGCRYCRCCSSSSNIANGVSGCCACNASVIEMLTGLKEDNLLYAELNEGAVFQPRFFIAEDPQTGNHVIAIRGTMSFSDVVTDLVAQPVPLAVEGVEDAYCHAGMLRSAEYILRCVESQPRLRHALLYANAPPLWVVGHSLGAGVALLLAIQMRQRLSTFRRPVVRCAAYAPPRGLCSPSLAAFTKGWAVGVTVGDDVVPRLSRETFDALRKRLVAGWDIVSSAPLRDSSVPINRVPEGQGHGEASPLTSVESGVNSVVPEGDSRFGNMKKATVYFRGCCCCWGENAYCEEQSGELSQRVSPPPTVDASGSRGSCGSRRNRRYHRFERLREDSVAMLSEPQVSAASQEPPTSAAANTPLGSDVSLVGLVDVIHFADISQPECCGNRTFMPLWVTDSSAYFNRLHISSYMVRDHFPDVYEGVLNDAVEYTRRKGVIHAAEHSTVEVRE